MARLITYIFSLTSLVCFYATANVEIHVPNSVDLIVVNGSNKPQNVPLILPAGEQQLVFKLTAKYRALGRNVEFVSDAIILKTQLADGRYTLNLPKIRNDKTAKAFNQKPEISISNNLGESFAIEQGKLTKSGLQVGRDYLQEVYVYNKSGLPASVAIETQHNSYNTYQAVSKTPVQVSTQDKIGTQKQVESMVTDTVLPEDTIEEQAEIEAMLNYWYKKASPETRSKFLEQIKP